MRHPKHFLADYVDGELTAAARKSVESHLSRCARCRESVETQEQMRNRLRNSGIPGPAEDLNARIMERTPSAAAQGQPAERRGVQAHNANRAQAGNRGFAARHRTTVAVGSAAAVVTLATLTGAYALGSESDAGLTAAAGSTTALAAGWQSVAEQTPVSLGADQLQRLRSGGWYCPELEAMGFEVRGAEAMTVGGRPTLRMTLVNGEETVTIYEQRKLDRSAGSGSLHHSGSADNSGSPGNLAGLVNAGGPVNAATGNTVASDGFERIGGMHRQLWVRAGDPWQLVLDSQTVTYTIVSGLPASEMPDAVTQLVHAEHSRLAQTPAPAADDPLSRIVRGLAKLTQPGSGH